MRHLTLFRFAILFLSASATAADEDYKPGPDAMPKKGVPTGKVTQHEWTSQIFPGTVRDYWVYVPEQYDGKTPAAVLICQDGNGFVRENGPFRAPTVLDNLIHAGDIPVTIGIFINPGVVPPAKEGQQPRKNRSFEYDTLSDQYARFCWKKSSRKLGRITSSPVTPPTASFVETARAGSALSRRPGSDPTPFAKSSVTLAVSRTFGAGMFTRR